MARDVRGVHLPRTSDLGPDPEPPGLRFERIARAAKRWQPSNAVNDVRGLRNRGRQGPSHVGLQRGRHR